MKVIRAILFIINLIAAIGLVLTTLAGTVLPSQTVLPSLAAYGYPLLLAFNLLLMLLWILMRRWEFMLSAAVIVARWAWVGMYVQVGGTSKVPPAEEHPARVVLMTWNVHQMQGRDVHSAPSAEFANAFLEVVRKQQPDVLCLQEYRNAGGVNVTDSLAVMGYNHYYGALNGSSLSPLGTAVFSRLPITYVQRLDQQKLLIEFMHEQRRFRLCAVHMDSYRFDDTDRQEIERARHGEMLQDSLRPTLSKVKRTIMEHEKEWTERLSPVVTQSSLPIVVAGDMNDIAGSWLYLRLAEHLKDAFREKGNGMSITFNGHFPQYRIDMVFCSEGMEVLSYRKIRTDVSDHYPVIAAMELVP